jgi:hypothetical protein
MQCLSGFFSVLAPFDHAKIPHQLQDGFLLLSPDLKFLQQ